MKQLKMAVLGLVMGVVGAVGYSNGIFDEAGQAKAAHAAFAKS